MTNRLHELMKLFNALETDADRIAFEAQWKAFLRSLPSNQDKHFAIQTLQEAILGNLSAYRKTLAALHENGELAEENVGLFSIPSSALAAQTASLK